MFLYNIHTSSKTFALQQKEGESFSSLLDRVAAKAGLPAGDITSLKKRKDGSGLVYEFEGGRWSLEDDDDLAILHERIPTSSHPSATLHLTVPQHHAHFAPSPAPPAYSTASSTIKSKSQSKTASKSDSKAQDKPETKSQPSLGAVATSSPVKQKDFSAPKANGETPPKHKVVAKADSEIAKVEKPVDKTADGTTVARPRSVRSALSTRSRKSKWGNDDAEPLGDVHKRQWLEFHSNNGVRTVMGKVGNVDGVRMLLKSGYKQVYISRSFAVKAGLLDKKFGMGSLGYTGLKTLGNVPITVGTKTSTHTALVNEEQHFDVVLGRQWLERMNIKIDPLDQTSLTYMDNGEPIPCDLVVLKDAAGNVITVT